MSVNLDFEGELEIFPAGYGPNKYAAAFAINYDYTPPYHGSRDDPPDGGGAFINAVFVRVNGEKAECPDWLEKLILDAIDEDTLIEHAREMLESAI